MRRLVMRCLFMRRLVTRRIVMRCIAVHRITMRCRAARLLVGGYAVLLATHTTILNAQAVVPTATIDSVYDVVIRNGRVLDGAGNPWILADVAINNGRFARIGRVTGRGRREIDA